MQRPENHHRGANRYGHRNIKEQIIVAHLSCSPVTPQRHPSGCVGTRHLNLTTKISLTFRANSLIHYNECVSPGLLLSID